MYETGYLFTFRQWLLSNLQLLDDISATSGWYFWLNLNLQVMISILVAFFAKLIFGTMEYEAWIQVSAMIIIVSGCFSNKVYLDKGECYDLQ